MASSSNPATSNENDTPSPATIELIDLDTGERDVLVGEILLGEPDWVLAISDPRLRAEVMRDLARSEVLTRKLMPTATRLQGSTVGADLIRLPVHQFLQRISRK